MRGDLLLIFGSRLAGFGSSPRKAPDWSGRFLWLCSLTTGEGNAGGMRLLEPSSECVVSDDER